MHLRLLLSHHKILDVQVLCDFLVVLNHIVVVFIIVLVILFIALGHIKMQLVRQSVIGTSVLAVKLLLWQKLLQCHIACGNHLCLYVCMFVLKLDNCFGRKLISWWWTIEKSTKSAFILVAAK